MERELSGSKDYGRNLTCQASCGGSGDHATPGQLFWRGFGASHSRASLLSLNPRSAS